MDTLVTPKKLCISDVFFPAPRRSTSHKSCFPLLHRLRLLHEMIRTHDPVLPQQKYNFSQLDPVFNAGREKESWLVATQICFIFTPKIGEDSHFDEYFSDGLVQPPTRKVWWKKNMLSEKTYEKSWNPQIF